MSYIGTQPVPQSLQSRQQFTGDGSTTTFATIGGVELYEDVFLNGVRLSRVDNEYSFDGTTLTITPAPANGDTVSIILRNDHSELIALPITDSAGNNVLSESGEVVTLTADEANVGSNALVVDSSGNVGIGTSPSEKLEVDGQIKATQLFLEQTSSAYVKKIRGNYNSQGYAQLYTVVRHYPVVSSGTKLIIPFVSNNNLNRTLICRVFGHSALWNTKTIPSFEVTFSVGHLNSLTNLSYWNNGGNVSSVATSGMNVEINFSTAYTSSTADGLFACLEFLTGTDSESIDISGITMN